MKKNQPGFSFVAILVILVSVGILIGVAYVAYDRFFSDQIDNPFSGIIFNDDTVTVDDLPAAPTEVTDSSDLDSAVSTLDSVNLDASQLDDIQSELDSF